MATPPIPVTGTAVRVTADRETPAAVDALARHQNNFNLIRLLAAAQVLIVHAGNHLGYQSAVLSALEVFPGVPIFFFISGFLIYTSFHRLGFPAWRAFYANRAVRIYPALWACTAVSILAVALTGYLHGRGVTPIAMARWLLGQVTFVTFYNPPFMRSFGTGVMNGSLWTIAVELQFYVAVPLLYVLLRKGRPAWLPILLVSLAVNVATRNLLRWDVLAWKLLYVSFLPWIYMFLTGFWVASRRDVQLRLLRLNATAVFVAYALSMLLIGDYAGNAQNGINPVSFALLTVLLLKFAFADFGRFGRLFMKTDVSYGLYLYHIPVINLLLYTGFLAGRGDFALTVAASVALASLSWWLVEKPALDLKKRWDRRATVPA